MKTTLQKGRTYTVFVPKYSRVEPKYLEKHLGIKINGCYHIGGLGIVQFVESNGTNDTGARKKKASLGFEVRS